MPVDQRSSCMSWSRVYLEIKVLIAVTPGTICLGSREQSWRPLRSTSAKLRGIVKGCYCLGSRAYERRYFLRTSVTLFCRWCFFLNAVLQSIYQYQPANYIHSIYSRILTFYLHMNSYSFHDSMLRHGSLKLVKRSSGSVTLESEHCFSKMGDSCWQGPHCQLRKWDVSML